MKWGDLNKIPLWGIRSGAGKREKKKLGIAIGVFEGGGRKYLYEQEVEETTSLMLNRIVDTYQRIAGGALGWDTIILTSGGSALLYQRLLPILIHENVVLADDMETIYLANVRGGLKLWQLYEALQLL